MTIWQKFGSKALKTWIKAFALHNLYLTIPCLIGAAIIGGAVIYSPKSVDNKSSPVKIESSKTITPTPSKSQTSPTTTPASSTAAASEPASQPVVEQPAPVIKPSPSSSVSNLTPVSSTTSSSGSSTSSSDSSSSSSSGSSLAPVTSGYESTNWSGYITPSGVYTSISAAWIADKPTGNVATTSTDATWIGIGGINSADLIQVGTDNNVSPGGIVSTSVFYEMLPADSVTVPGLSITPGDNISASITEISSNNWQISITDITTGATFSIIVTYDSSNSSAEWIEEDPSFDNGRQAPFDDYGQVDMADCQTINAGATDNLNEAFAQAVTMVNSFGQAESTPSVIASNGNSFNTYYDAAQ